MKKILVVILGLILLRIVYDYVDSQNYFSESINDDVVMEGGKPYAIEKYKRYISLKNSTNNKDKRIKTNKILLHIDYSEIKNADTYQLALYI
jgi:tRNA U34 5-carboxymethylaminomethyl modifying enzyme MnmG/GidA